MKQEKQEKRVIRDSHLTLKKAIGERRLDEFAKQESGRKGSRAKLNRIIGRAVPKQRKKGD